MKNNYLATINMVFRPFFAAALLFFSVFVSAQGDYSVTPIPFQIYAASTPVQGTADDSYSAPIPLGFNFDFYGAQYNQIHVSTNGYISFSPQLQGSFSPWSYSVTIPNATFPVENAFLGCFHDMNNSNAEGTITYATVGAAPYRKVVVLFDNQSQFSCTQLKSSFQMIIYETLNILDVQLIDKPVCNSWNGGRAVTGIVDLTGLQAISPPGRNTGSWAASQEGWRFQRPMELNSYLFAKCDDDSDGFASFNLQVAQGDLSPTDPQLVSFYESELDAISQTNALSSLNFTNTVANLQVLYANVNGEVKSVVLRVINCNNDYDLDAVATADEDLNNDGNLANDDTDQDGIPNFIDNDDDGDMILTTVEYVFTRSANASLLLADTDNDGIPNYLDDDDDGDGVLTILEDYNGNNNPADDDTNGNTIPDYLEITVALGTTGQLYQNQIALYPNPAGAVLHIDNKSSKPVKGVSIYNVNGLLVKSEQSANDLKQVSVSDLQSGVYFVRMQLDQTVLNYKFVKQ